MQTKHALGNSDNGGQPTTSDDVRFRRFRHLAIKLFTIHFSKVKIVSQNQLANGLQ